MTKRAFELRFSMWARLARLPKGATPHWLRHSFAKNIMRTSTAHDRHGIAQAALGHASRRSTEVYTMIDREEVVAALSEVDAAVNGRPRVSMSELRKSHEQRRDA